MYNSHTASVPSNAATHAREREDRRGVDRERVRDAGAATEPGGEDEPQQVGVGGRD